MFKLLAILIALSTLLPVPARAADDPSTSPDTSQPSPAGAPAPLTEPMSDLTLYALSLNGTSYKYGGEDPESGLDCSGFVANVFQQAVGISLPHSAKAISHLGRKIGIDDLRPGDLVFFNTLRHAFSHVGIYLGNNHFIHASSSATGDVMISDITERYWTKRFDGARRLDISAR
jgi:cell wall-associated NlpC family hydrolase